MRGLSGDLFDSNWPQPVIANFAESLLLLLLSQSYFRKAKKLVRLTFQTKKLVTRPHAYQTKRPQKRLASTSCCQF